MLPIEDNHPSFITISVALIVIHYSIRILVPTIKCYCLQVTDQLPMILKFQSMISTQPLTLWLNHTDFYQPMRPLVPFPSLLFSFPDLKQFLSTSLLLFFLCQSHFLAATSCHQLISFASPVLKMHCPFYLEWFTSITYFRFTVTPTYQHSFVFLQSFVLVEMSVLLTTAVLSQYHQSFVHQIYI